MKKLVLLANLFLVVNIVSAAEVTTDTFGTGDNQFKIDFVTISGDAGSSNETIIGEYYDHGFKYKTFTDPGDYRMSMFEITNGQWNKFKASYGTVAGNPTNAYELSPNYTGLDIPTDKVSWYETLQFVNYLNTSTGHQPAYKFTGRQGSRNYSFAAWESGDEGYSPSNPFRNSTAFYFLPTDDEWVKAAYFNGKSLQTYATADGSTPLAGVDTNYDDSLQQLWDVGSGSEELNGTFDMMGNALEWLESPYYCGNYQPGTFPVIRGGTFYNGDYVLKPSFRNCTPPFNESSAIGFRVAAVVPEPTTLLLFGLGGLVLRRQNKI